jgi:hypothetical protein
VEPGGRDADDLPVLTVQVLVFGVVLGAAVAAAGERPREAATPIVVVELFTSEGCSSCPPADDLLARLEADQPIPGARIIALSEHVDYWNRLGWTDPFSSKRFSERQNAYADVFRKPSVYTPQMVVDGQVEFTGSDARRAKKEIESAARTPKAAVEIARDGASNGIRIRVASLPAGDRREKAEVLLALVEDGITSDVRRGENAGRRLAHTAVVRRLEVIGAMDSAQAAFEKRIDVTPDPSWRRDRLRAVAFIQEKESRRILGAGQLGL